MKNIKQIAHDLSPMCDIASELSSVICELLDELAHHMHKDSDQLIKYFSESVEASKQLTNSIGLMKEYIDELHIEADQCGVTKD
jgi:hypothetical protein